MHEKPEKEGYTPRKQRIPLNLGPRSVARARKAAGGPASERAESDMSDPSGGEQPSDYNDCASARAKPGPKMKKRKKAETASDSAACGGSERVCPKSEAGRPRIQRFLSRRLGGPLALWKIAREGQERLTRGLRRAKRGKRKRVRRYESQRLSKHQFLVNC